MASSNSRALPSVVHTIEKRVEQLITDHRRVSELNRELREQCEALKEERRAVQEQVTKLEKELAIYEVQGGLAGSAKSNNRARAYINRLMREVDACITLISSPGGANKEEASERGASERGASEQGASEQGTSERGASEEVVSEQGASEQGTSERGASEEVVSEAGEYKAEE